MLYQSVKKVLSESFSRTKDIAKMATRGYEINLSEAASDIDKHMIDSAKNLIKEGAISSKAINEKTLKLSPKEALRVRYSSSQISSRSDRLMDDMAHIGKVAAAGIIGLRTTQAAVGLLAGSGD